METAMIYARVSTTEQRKNYSLETQHTKCRMHCDTHGYRVLGEWTDAHSGTDRYRPGMEALLDAAVANTPDVVVVAEVDRLGREEALNKLKRELIMIGISRIEFVDGGVYTIEDNDMLVEFKGMMTKFENRLRVGRSRDGKETRIKNGNVLPVAGKAPYGYDYISGGKGKGEYRINEQEADVVRKIYDWLVQDRLSSYQIAQRIHAMGVPSRGDVSSVAKKNGYADWSPTTVRRIVVNTIYRGEYIYGKYRYIKRDNVRLKPQLQPENEWLRVAVEPIVTADTWEQAQVRLSENKANATRNTKREYLLRGMIFCTCGRRWTGRFKTNVQRAYYRCGANEAETWRSNCDAKFSYRVEDLDNIIWQKVTEYLLKPDTMIQEIRRQREESTADAAKRERRLTVARKELASIEKKLAGLLHSEVAGGYPANVLAQTKAELMERHTNATNEVARLEQEQQTVDITPDTEAALLELSSTMRDALPAMAFAEKRKVLELLRTRIEVLDKDTVRLSGLITNGAVVNTSHSSRR